MLSKKLEFDILKNKIWSLLKFWYLEYNWMHIAILLVNYLIKYLFSYNYFASRFDLSSTSLTNSQLFELSNHISRLRLRNTVPRIGKNSNNFAILFEEIRFFEARTSSTLPQFTFHRTHHRQRPPFINMSNYLLITTLLLHLWATFRQPS